MAHNLKKALFFAGLVGVGTVSSYLLYKYINKSSGQKKKGVKNSKDVSSFSNLDEVVTKNIHLDLNLDFAKKSVSGNAILEMESLVGSLSEVDLDIKALKINEVFINGEKSKFKIRVIAEREELGQQLNIELPRSYKVGQTFTLSVQYETNVTEESNAWNWLSPEQTLGKKLPYLFTQCEPTFCRSVFPCQDSPSVKSKYTAKVTSPGEIKVYMSAKQTKTSTNKDGLRVSEFSLDIPIPSYLIALVAGDLELTRISQRTAVITEPGKMEDCVKELSDMEHYLSALEDYAFAYVWGEYNIVILPPSFPYGGMENPLLTFASPSIIVGDKSNTDTVIHEMAHSWSGNLVSCKNWTEFWLNEGITVYIERQTIRRLRGEDAYKLASYIGLQSLNETVNNFGPEHNFTTLQPDLRKHHPDDAFSIVPYEKGFLFLTYLEYKIGASQMQKFLRQFFTQFMHRSVDSRDFKELFKSFCIEQEGNEEGLRIFNSVAWEQWLEKPGMPFYKFEFDSEERQTVLDLAKEFLSCDDDKIPEKFQNMNELSTEQRIIFLKEMSQNQDTLSMRKLEYLDSKSGLGFQTNPEVVQQWYLLAIRKGLRNNFSGCAEFLGSIGRLKYIKPLYRELVKADRDFALEVFNHYKDCYHSISNQVLKKVLDL